VEGRNYLALGERQVQTHESEQKKRKPKERGISQKKHNKGKIDVGGRRESGGIGKEEELEKTGPWLAIGQGDPVGGAYLGGRPSSVTNKPAKKHLEKRGPKTEKLVIEVKKREKRRRCQGSLAQKRTAQMNGSEGVKGGTGDLIYHQINSNG